MTKRPSMNVSQLILTALLLPAQIFAATAPQPSPAQPPAARPSAAQPASVKPTSQEMEQIQSKLAALKASMNSLRSAKAADDLLVDVEVCQRAAELTLRIPEEFYSQQHINNALGTLNHGLERAQQLKDGTSAWAQAKGRVARAYRSRVDGTPQPYRVIVPTSYDGSTPMPLYVTLHGRGNTDYEINWLMGRDRTNAVPSRNFLELQPYGR